MQRGNHALGCTGCQAQAKGAGETEAGGAKALAARPDILFGQLLPKLIPQQVRQEINAKTAVTTDESAALERVMEIAKEASERASVVERGHLGRIGAEETGGASASA